MMPSNYDPSIGQKQLLGESIDATDKALADARTRRDSPKAYEDKAFSGVSPAIPLGVSGGAMAGALNAQANRLQGIKNQNRRTSYELEQPLETFDKTSHAGGLLASQEAVENNNLKELLSFQQRRKALFDAKKQAEDQATANVISSLLGLGLSIGATVLSGGAAAPSLVGAGANVAKAFAPGQSRAPMEQEI